MPARVAIWLTILSLCGSGCATIADATHISAYQIRQSLDESQERQRNTRWAQEAWEGVRASQGGTTLSADYGRGFREGFADHLFRGTTEPPPMAPRYYRSLCYQTPAGYRALEEWFAGFRHGVAEASAQGFRDLVTGPSSLRSSPAPVTPMFVPPADSIPAQQVPSDILPPPRKLMPTRGNEGDNSHGKPGLPLPLIQPVTAMERIDTHTPTPRASTFPGTSRPSLSETKEAGRISDASRTLNNPGASRLPLSEAKPAGTNGDAHKQLALPGALRPAISEGKSAGPDTALPVTNFQSFEPYWGGFSADGESRRGAGDSDRPEVAFPSPPWGSQKQGRQYMPAQPGTGYFAPRWNSPSPPVGAAGGPAIPVPASSGY